jgi:hypothetical protein
MGISEQLAALVGELANQQPHFVVLLQLGED